MSKYRAIFEKRYRHNVRQFCEDLPDNTIIFLNVGPHERAYAMREPQAEYADA
jgi:hypothetical protein